MTDGPGPGARSQVLAVRYATLVTRTARQYYRFSAYGEADEAMNLDYYFWVVRDGDSVVLVDCGFSLEAAAARPDRQVLVPPVEALRACGVEPDQVARVILSHFHYDHVGNLNAFPEARFTAQRRELEFWTGPYASLPSVAAGAERADLEFIVEAQRAGRVDVVDGPAWVTGTVSVELVGGHCPGQQVVRIDGPDGAAPTVLCSDAVHFYGEMELSRPHHGVFDLVAMFATYERMREVATGGGVVVPGHDADVMRRFPSLPGCDGLAVVVA